MRLLFIAPSILYTGMSVMKKKAKRRTSVLRFVLLTTVDEQTDSEKKVSEKV